MQRTRIVFIGLVASLTACSPALNWRTVTLDAVGLTALLPCKPDHAARTVDLGAVRSAELSMIGCDADGATFAVSHVRIEEPAQADATLALWQAAVRARMHASPEASAQALPAATAFVPPGALQLPQSVRVQLQGRAGEGGTVVAQGAWFARLEGTHARLYHAVVYSPAPRPDVAQTFLDGLRLQ